MNDQEKYGYISRMVFHMLEEDTGSATAKYLTTSRMLYAARKAGMLTEDQHVTLETDIRAWLVRVGKARQSPKPKVEQREGTPEQEAAIAKMVKMDRNSREFITHALMHSDMLNDNSLNDWILRMCAKHKGE